MTAREVLVERLRVAGLWDMELDAMNADEMGLLCRLVLEAHVQALPEGGQGGFFCPHGRRVGKGAVQCRANLHALGASRVPARCYGVPLGYCLHYCVLGNSGQAISSRGGERSGRGGSGSGMSACRGSGQKRRQTLQGQFVREETAARRQTSARGGSGLPVAGA